ncbi:unnamed protein product [Linum trigynum]|uniref:Uncharacterized protein n=1 Tax=Linum trigynum TaxID=586398 RepID=A0AAV2F4K5_9ROSI
MYCVTTGTPGSCGITFSQKRAPLRTIDPSTIGCLSSFPAPPSRFALVLLAGFFGMHGMTSFSRYRGRTQQVIVKDPSPGGHCAAEQGSEPSYFSGEVEVASIRGSWVETDSDRLDSSELRRVSSEPIGVNRCRRGAYRRAWSLVEGVPSPVPRFGGLC